jgi:membrane-associated phospholipid phosphatase
MVVRGSTSAFMCGSEGAMTVAPARMDPALPSARRGPFTQLKAFLAPWRTLPVRALRPTFAAAAVAGFTLALLAAIGFFADPPTARAAAALSPGAVTFFRFITQFGESGYLLILSGALAVLPLALSYWPRWRRTALAVELMCGRAAYFFIVIALTGIVAQLIKHMVGRARPSLMGQFGVFHFDVLSMRASLASFPSGHATTAFAAATALALLVPASALPLFAAASMIAASRLAIGAHYFSDVVAGSLLGIVCTLLVARAFARRGLVFESDAKMFIPRGRGLIVAVCSRAWSREP